MNLEQLRAELGHWQTRAAFFGQIGASRNRQETLKEVRRIEKAIKEKQASKD
jgi:hypothetical protein